MSKNNLTSMQCINKDCTLDSPIMRAAGLSSIRLNKFSSDLPLRRRFCQFSSKFRTDSVMFLMQEKNPNTTVKYSRLSANEKEYNNVKNNNKTEVKSSESHNTNEIDIESRNNLCHNNEYHMDKSSQKIVCAHHAKDNSSDLNKNGKAYAANMKNGFDAEKKPIRDKKSTTFDDQFCKIYGVVGKRTQLLTARKTGNITPSLSYLCPISHDSPRIFHNLLLRSQRFLPKRRPDEIEHSLMGFTTRHSDENKRYCFCMSPLSPMMRQGNITSTNNLVPFNDEASNKKRERGKNMVMARRHESIKRLL